MNMRRAAVLLVLALAGLPMALADNGCTVTQPNGDTPPGERASAAYHGNGFLWTALWPDGTVTIQGGAGVVRADGSLAVKFPWWRGAPGKLSIEGRPIP